MGSENNDMTLIIQHMGKKEPMAFPAGTRLRDLQTAVEQRTRVPVDGQKVVHRGRDLARNDPDLALEDCRLKDKDVVMILGRPLDPASDEAVAAVGELEKQSQSFASRLDTIQTDIDGLEKGFVPAPLAGEARTKLERRLLGVSEELMRLLERLDAVSATSQEARRRRKAVVTAVNAQMDRAEAMRAKLSAAA